MRPRRSLIWGHFVNSEMNRAVCRHCSKQISFNGGSIGNLSRHMKLRHAFILNNEGEEDIPEKQEPKDQSSESEQQLLVEQPKSLKLNKLKRKYEIIDGKVASPSPPESDNPSAAFDEDMIPIYEKPIEFEDSYIKGYPFITEMNSEHVSEPKASNIAKPQSSRNQNLEDLKTREEIKLLRAKTVFFTTQKKNLDVERSLTLLKVKKLELEVEKLQNEANGNPLPNNQMGSETVSTVKP